MGQQLYFDNYTATGDIVVIAICMVLAILLATSFVVRSKSFMIFVNMIFYAVLAALTDMIYHDRYPYITDGNYTLIYVLRVLYHVFLFTLFLLFIVYLVHVLELTRRERIPSMVGSSVIYFVVLITDIVTSVMGAGFRLNKDGTAVSGLNIFMFGDIAFLLVIAALIVKYRNRVYKNAIVGVVGTIIVSFLIMFNQGRHGQSSLTVATFLFPILSIMYLMHANPFDIRTGAVSAASLMDAVRYSYSKKQEFFFISMLLPDFHSEGTPLPKGLQQELREFPSRHFKKAILFRISNGQMILMMPVKCNPEFNDKLRLVLDAFQRDYEEYHFDYKVIIGRSVEEISRKNEYLSFIKSIQRNMKLNSVHTVGADDVSNYKLTEDIRTQLEDIFRKKDLDDERVLAYCQPVYNIRSGKYDTAEALMRLKLPELGLVFPDKFIPLAEEYGYIHVLTRIILHKTCEAIRDMIGEGYELNRISVNVSTPELRDPAFTKELEEIIHSSGIPNGKIAIEITESQSESDLELIKGMIDELKDTGIKFYLDDFGTGYSNMERIMKLPFDIIKFDRSLVMACKADKRSEEIVGRLAGMFADLDYSVLYEGVETDTDEERCIRMSASYLQGYKYSRPVPIEELRNYFSKTG